MRFKKKLSEIFLITITLYFVALPVFGQNNIGEKTRKDTVLAAKFYKEARQKAKINDYAGSLLAIDSAIKYNPEKYLYYVFRGEQRKELKQFKEAIKDVETAIQLNPKSPAAYQTKGDCEKELKQYEEAIKDFSMVIELYPGSTGTYYDRYICRMTLNKDLDEALKDIEFVLSKNLSLKLILEKAALEFELKKYRASIIDFNIYLKYGTESDTMSAHFYRGLCFYYMNKLDSSILDLKHVAINKPSREVFTHLANAYRNKGDTVTARKYYDKGLQLESAYFGIYYEYGLAAYFAHNCPKASGLFEDYLKFMGNSYQPASGFFCDRAKIKACLGDSLGAMDDFKKAEELAENNYKVYMDRILVFFRSYSFNKIIQDDISKLIKIYPDTSEIPALLGMRGYLKQVSKDTLGAEQDFLAEKKHPRYFSVASYNLAVHYFYFRKRDIYKNEIFRCVEDINKAGVFMGEYYELKALALVALNHDSRKACSFLEKAKKKNKQYNNFPQIESMRELFCGAKIYSDTVSNAQLILSDFIDEDGSSALMKYLHIR